MSKDTQYLVQKSKEPDKWVCTDTIFKIVIVWETGKFNDTQKVIELDDFNPENYMKLAKIMREIGDYLVINHSELL